MPQERLMIRVLRKEDFLDLTFELVNLHADGEPPRLVRSTANEPALLIVHFPPQHIVEEAFRQNEEGTLTPGPAPVRAMLAGPSRLVFELPNDQGDWPLTLETLLNWQAYTPVLAPNALPPGATTGPGIAQPILEQTALEIPTGLYLSPDENGAWVHKVPPIEHDGRYELWHTRLGAREPGGEGKAREDLDRYARAIWTTNPAIPFRNSLTPDDQGNPQVDSRPDIARLTSDFSLPQMPSVFLRLFGKRLSVLRWRQFLGENGFPAKYIPKPIKVRRLMLSAAGAWANLESAWDYPTIIPGRNDDLGYPKLTLEQWQHIAAQGRDQFALTVKKAFLCDPANRVSIVTTTEREFHPLFIRTEETAQGPVSIRGTTAFLRQYERIKLQEPLKEYASLAQAYENGSREMPFRQLRILTQLTPALDPHTSPIFWPMVGEKPFPFQMVAEDWDGRTVTFERPLLCVPLDALSDHVTWETVVTIFNEGAPGAPPEFSTLPLRTVQTHAQSIAFAESAPDEAGKTTLKTDTVVFEAQEVKGDKIQHLPTPHPLFLPTVKAASVSLPSVERLLGRPSPVDIQFDPDYLVHGMDPAVNKGEVFATLTQPLDLPFAAEKAGGLIKPDTSIQGVSRALGPVANPTAIKQGTFDTSMFDQARFLGGITLKDIIEAGDFDLADVKVADLPLGDLQAQLDKPTFKLKVPMLTSRLIYPPGVNPDRPTAKPTAAETRFLWKPVVKNHTLGILTLETNEKTQLVLQARLVTPLDNQPSTYDIDGRLKSFALNFAEAMRLTFVSLSFRAESGKKMDVSADGMDLEFDGPLKFVNTLKNILPANGFSDPPYLDVTASGIRAGYTLGVPSVGVGIFSIQNINLSAGLSLPFVDQPLGVRFAISERHKPFLVTVALFGGGGFFALGLNAHGIEQIEAAIEFGGNISLNLGVASGGVYVMAGIYFSMAGNEVKLTGYLRCGGYLSVLGLISISLEFYLGFTYRKKGNGGEAWGQASLTVCVKVAFFSKSVTLTVERKFAGAAGDPTFEQLVEPDDWEAYCAAFA